MKTTIGVYEAKTQLSRLIDRAAAGERIVITRNGNAVAELRAVPAERFAPDTIVAKFKAFRQRQSPSGTLRHPHETLRELAHEGTRPLTPPVIDASVAAKWLLRDERSKAADAVLTRVSRDGAFVPAIFAFEIENILIVAERRKRIDAAAVGEAIGLMKTLAFQVDPYAFLSLGRHTEITRRYMLSVYDAAYVVSAAHLRTEFFTADSRLADAARREKIATVLVT